MHYTIIYLRTVCTNSMYLCIMDNIQFNVILIRILYDLPVLNVRMKMKIFLHIVCFYFHFSLFQIR